MNPIEFILGIGGLCLFGFILFLIFWLVLAIVASLPVIGIFATVIMRFLGMKR